MLECLKLTHSQLTKRENHERPGGKQRGSALRDAGTAARLGRPDQETALAWARRRSKTVGSGSSYPSTEGRTTRRFWRSLQHGLGCNDRCDAAQTACRKKGLIVGIANDQSIAWGCAKVFHASGAHVLVTYRDETLYIDGGYHIVD
jgi:hypothetical protein